MVKSGGGIDVECLCPSNFPLSPIQTKSLLKAIIQRGLTPADSIEMILNQNTIIFPLHLDSAEKILEIIKVCRFSKRLVYYGLVIWTRMLHLDRLAFIWIFKQPMIDMTAVPTTSRSTTHTYSKFFEITGFQTRFLGLTLP